MRLLEDFFGRFLMQVKNRPQLAQLAPAILPSGSLAFRMLI
ncbi:hypothetical protein DSOL_4405 [Desulfosporosinus metallidurans]|uniref:Uncharacterized protein n=1 Tax=Desulfosporosinus metallidurans TaxID=1888891 RepID=A0A1Q8QK26_9FIRM|nr:hypothetical protein DSOL_4405 [Desulfosporosinus metallidurans]